MESVVLLQGDALFGFDRDTLSTTGRAAIDALIAKLSSLDDLLSIHIIGHTDATGDESYNHDLSLRRANAIARRFAARFPDSYISLAGAGETNPLGDNGTSTGRKLNRRVEIEIVGTGNRAQWQNSP